MSLFDTGIRPVIDEYLTDKGAEIRDYGDYWSASSAGYCMRKLIFERLGVPPVKKDSDERKQRVFQAGHLFHQFIQEITKGAGLSLAQELELQDEELMVRGHIDDLVLIAGPVLSVLGNPVGEQKLMLYDYKTQHANAFTWQKGRPPSYFHRMQVGTYMYMLRKEQMKRTDNGLKLWPWSEPELTEARVLKISKDDLRMDENQILWDTDLEAEVLSYWGGLNRYWEAKKIPPCTCADREGGFMSKEKFNPYWYNGQPCSIELYQEWKLTKERTA